MQNKSSDKLGGFQRHLFFCIRLPVIFVSKAYHIIVYISEAMITNSYFVGIPAHVFYYLRWSTKWTFGIYNPGCMKEIFKECFGLLWEGLSQSCHITCSEYRTECFYRK